MSKLSLSFFVAISIVGCDTNLNHQSSPEARTSYSAIVLNGAGDAMCGLFAGDPSCNAEGPGQRLEVDADGCCRLYISDDTCVASDDSTELTCAYTSCGTDLECQNASDDPENLAATCLYTQTTFEPEGFGACFYAWADCEVMPGTPCHGEGVNYCLGGECFCSAVPNIDAATLETCDGVDNNCDGEVDEVFVVVGDGTCDGDDADQCKNGTFTCTADGLALECVNEVVENVVETCNGLDDDCDGQVDEAFPVGKVCDGNDADLCMNGTQTCTANGLALECVNEVVENVVETCNGLDDDCDGQADEGCDSDLDGWCDSAMLVAIGANCVSGDCDDEHGDIHQGSVDKCDGIDNNCNGQMDEGFGLGDACTDGHGVCQGQGTYSSCSQDALSAVCDAVANPNAMLNAEVCNGLDDTCDGQADEGCDDDSDGWCDNTLVVGQAAACVAGDCNDDNAGVNPDVVEVCDNKDNNCDGQVDDGCDDDNDGWCDFNMLISIFEAVCQPGDCDDADKTVNPGVEEQCLTPGDDNCDWDTEFLLDGVTPACDSCANALELPCGEDVEIDMATEPNAANAIESYQCNSRIGPVQINKIFSGREIVVVPDADAGTEFSLQIVSPGTGAYAFRLNGSCEPSDVGVVTALSNGGTCAAYSRAAVGGGIVGEDFVAIDAVEDSFVTVRFTCLAPD